MSYTERSTEHFLDLVAVNDLIQRERLARDNRFWDEMASYYHPDSKVEVSWFKGSGAEFVARTKKSVREDSINFHVMSPAVVTVKNDRAIAETPCILRSFSHYDGADVSFEGFVRLLWRAQRHEGLWLIAGLRCIYVRDMLLACNPSKPPQIDEDALRKYRLSYRYTCYNLAKMGQSPADDLPGVDRPEMVAALREGERLWLEEG
jgi:hypothetical protein